MSDSILKFQNSTSSLGPDNRVFSSYLPDGTLMARQFRSVRTRTTVRVNSKGDTIVRTIREPVIDRTLYRGDWEINGSVWRLNTPEGIATVVKNTSTSDAQGGASAGRTFTHLWYVRDRLGSVRTVLDDEGTIRQCTMFYPSGLPVQLFGTERVTDRAHIGNRWSNFAGLGWHDNTARWHDAILGRFTTPDPKSADYPSFSPYTHCAANPLRFTDPTGCDTVAVNYTDGKWVINSTKLAEGNDVFIVNIDGKEQQYAFNIGDYGERVDALNLEITDKYALGIMHVSGSEDNYYYVAPGGQSSNSVGSGARINDGIYPIQAPTAGAKWQKPELGGSVAGRGIRFHYGGNNLRRASSGCFIITDDYEIENGVVTPGIGSSKTASRKFDASLGASGYKNYIVPGSKNKIREGSTFRSPIKFVLVLKTL